MQDIQEFVGVDDLSKLISIPKVILYQGLGFRFRV